MYLQLESTSVSSPCPLLAPETAVDYLPSVHMPVPRRTAWVSLSVRVERFADRDGAVDHARLEEALHRCIDEGDRQHDNTEWHEPLVEYDSWLNRRLAIALRGWGNLVEQSGADPQAIETLREMETLAEWICSALHKRSRWLARGNNWCPALDEAGARVLRKNVSSRWSRRWQRAIDDVAVRHRNLSTMSPWDVFPSGKPADMRFADLLPVTRFADSLAFQCDVDFTAWNASDFKRFRTRVAAAAKAGQGQGLIAKQV